MFLQEKLQEINSRLQVLEKLEDIVVWGAGVHTGKMFEMTDAISYNIKNIVDIDEKKQGKKYFGFIVKNPYTGLDWKNVDAVIISAHGKEKVITETLRKELHFCGQILVLYTMDEQKPFYCLPDKEDSQLCHVGNYADWIQEIRSRLNVENWVSEDFCGTPKEYAEKKNSKKIMVAILHCEETSYNMIRSLYDAFEADDSCMPIIILQGKGYGNRYQELEVQMKENGMRYEFDYNCVDMTFDVLIVHHVQLPPTDDVKCIINHSTLKVAVPVGVISYNTQGINVDNIRAYKATEIFCEESIYERTSKDILNEFHCYPTGNPKFDCIYNAYLHKVKIPVKFEKLQHPAIKKIILWTTDHCSNFQVCTEDVAFDLYADTVFDYMKKHPEVGLIFRPYRTYIYGLVKDGLMTQEQVDYFKSYCDQSRNIVWDNEPDYSVSYSMADAIIADAGCGIICSALPMMKPIGVTLRWDMNVNDIIDRNREILEHHYMIFSKEEIILFFDMVMEGKDPNFEQRKKICDKYITHFDGKNGMRIRDIIKKIREQRSKEIYV